MKMIKSIVIGTAFGGGLIVGLHLLHAQETAMSAQSLQTVNAVQTAP